MIYTQPIGFDKIAIRNTDDDNATKPPRILNIFRESVMI